MTIDASLHFSLCETLDTPSPRKGKELLPPPLSSVGEGHRLTQEGEMDVDDQGGKVEEREERKQKKQKQ